MAITTGRLDGSLPYVQFGTGPKPLVVIPGASDPLSGPKEGFRAWLLRWYFRRYTDTHSIYYVSRPTNLPEGYSIDAMAADYADALFDRFVEPVDVVGISMGGCIAQMLAADRPELVDRLVLVASACRLSDRGRSLVERWAADAAEWTENGHDHDHDHDWSAVYTELIDATYDGWRRTAYRTLVGTLGERLIGPPPVPRDVRISMESLASFDACDRLGSISAPTLLVAGDDDVFFDEWTIIDTGEAISNATVYLFEESGHGAFDEHKDAFDRTVRSFLT